MATKKQPSSGVRQPDYDLAVLNRENNQKGRIGAAWTNPDGSISIRLNPLVVLDSRPELLVTLFKRTATAKKSAGNQYVPNYNPADTEPPPF